LTGFIPWSAASGFGIQPRFCSFDDRLFSQTWRGEWPGTFVPKPYYSSSPCAAPAVARKSNSAWKSEVRVMLGWVVTFLIIALIAGILGFGGVAGASIEMAKIIFFIAVVLFLVSAVVGLARGRTRV
jgi:uncharacterized membrane protein YtjA (UPF0391 family)